MLIKINHYRRRLMRSLTKHVGKQKLKKPDQLNRSEIKKILICRPNHRLGNMLLTTPLVQEINTLFPDAKIDILAKGGLAPIIFQNYPNINNYYLLPRKPFKQLFKYVSVWVSLKFRKYDLVINGVKDSSSGKLLTAVSNAKHKIYGTQDESQRENFFYNDEHMAKNIICHLRNYFYLRDSDYTFPFLDLKLSDAEIKNGKEKLIEVTKNDRKTICLFTFATGNKCYSVDWWESFYKELTKRYAGNYNIIEMLPVENVSQINFKAPSIYSKDIREMAAIMANTIFIGADSGIMHLASAANAPTIGLFSITDQLRYGPYNSGSFALNTNNKTPKECADLLLKL